MADFDLQKWSLDRHGIWIPNGNRDNIWFTIIYPFSHVEHVEHVEHVDSHMLESQNLKLQQMHTNLVS